MQMISILKLALTLIWEVQAQALVHRRRDRMIQE
jgi:hypothetical protein